MRLKILLAGFCLGSFFVSAHAEDSLSTANPDPQKIQSLKMQDCLGLALKNNLDLYMERLNPQIALQRVRGEKGIFDPKFKAGVEYEDNTQPLTSQASIAAGGLAEIEADTLSYETAFEGKVPTGLEYRVGYDQGRTQSTFNQFHSEYDTFAGVTLTQPLLKNFGFSNNLALVRIARKNHQISFHAFQLRAMEVVAKTRDGYWDLVFAIEDAKVRKESLDLAASLLRENKKRVEVGVLSPLEVTQAEAGVAEREEAVIVSERAIRDQENVLKRLIYQDVSHLVGTQLQPVDYPTVELDAVSKEACIKKALAHRSELFQIHEELEKLDIQVKTTRNQAFPEVDVEGSYGINGLKDNPGGSFDHAFTADQPVWTLGMTVEVPLWNRKNKSEHAVTQLQKKQQLARLKQMKQQIIIEVDNACGRVQSNLKRVEATQAARKFAEEALRAEETKLRNGVSTSHTVLEFQEAFSRAKSAHIKAIVDYNKSRNELAKAQGTLLAELGIEVDEK